MSFAESKGLTPFDNTGQPPAIAANGNLTSQKESSRLALVVMVTTVLWLTLAQGRLGRKDQKQRLLQRG